MPHYSRLAKIVIDVPAEAERATVDFWSEATGARLQGNTRYPEYHGGFLPGDAMGLLVQRLADGGPRVHIDIHTDDVAAEVGRLERLGASKVDEINSWTVMRDPAGLLFCVLPDPPGRLDDSNATRWP